MTVQEKLAMIKQQRAESKVQRQLAMLDNQEYVEILLAKEDAKLLDRILDDLSKAYGKPIFTGFTYNENIEKLVAICNKLQYAKADIRELIDSSYYELFDRTIREMVIDAYGMLPYFREPTVVELSDGTKTVLDADLVDKAKQGIKPNVDKLQLAIDILSDTLNLQATYRVSEEEADKAWEQAVNKINKLERLQLIAKDYEQSL